jgi:hypothetical protein
LASIACRPKREALDDDVGLRKREEGGEGEEGGGRREEGGGRREERGERSEERREVREKSEEESGEEGGKQVFAIAGHTRTTVIHTPVLTGMEHITI